MQGGELIDPGPSPIQPRTSAAAIASLIFSILGALCCLPPGSIVGIICGFVGRSNIRKSGGRLGGETLALSGIVIGFLGLVFGAVMLAIFAPQFTQMMGGVIDLANRMQKAEQDLRSGEYDSAAERLTGEGGMDPVEVAAEIEAVVAQRGEIQSVVMSKPQADQTGQGNLKPPINAEYRLECEQGVAILKLRFELIGGKYVLTRLDVLEQR